jgi:hypothetical protein
MMQAGLFGIVLMAVGAVGRGPAQTPPPSEASGPPPTVRVEFVSPAAPQPQERDSAVIFYDDFDRPADLHARYFEYGDAEGSFVWNPTAGYGGRGGAMQCQFEKGQVTAGSLKVVFGRNPFHRGVRPQETFREIYWRVYVRHQEGWEGNPAKLARATCLAGEEWSQGFIAHVWGGKGDMLCIDPATGITDSRKVTTKYNDFDHLRWLGSRQGQTPLFSPAESGRWVCVESHIRLNTPGKKDGVFALWVDGRLEASRDDMDWHGTWDDYAINAVFLENYWNSGSVKRQARWMDNFVISTQPIGPIVTTAAPSFQRTAGTGVTVWEAQAATDPEGRDVVWAAKSVDGAARSLTIDAAHGAFAGSRAGQKRLAAGVTHWLRLREKNASGRWSDWTAWHAPFRTAP